MGPICLYLVVAEMGAPERTIKQCTVQWRRVLDATLRMRWRHSAETLEPHVRVRRRGSMRMRAKPMTTSMS